MLRELVESKTNEGMQTDSIAYQRLAKVMDLLSHDVKFGKVVEVGEGYKYEVEIKDGELYFDSLEDDMNLLSMMWISFDKGKAYLVCYDEDNNPDVGEW